MESRANVVTTKTTNSDNVKKKGGSWKVVKESVEEIGTGSLGVVGVRDVLVKSNQKQDVSNVIAQQQGVVAVRNHLTEIKNYETDDNDLLRRPSSGILGVRGYMTSDKGKPDNSEHEYSKPSNDETVKEMDGEWRIAMNQEKPPDQLNQSCGVVAVKDTLTVAEKKVNNPNDESTKFLTGDDDPNQQIAREWKVVEVKMEEIHPKGIGIIGVKKALVEPKHKRFSIQNWQRTVGIVGVKNFMLSGEKKTDCPDDQDDQIDASNLRNKAETDADISENIKNLLNCESDIKDTRETSSELSTFVTNKYIELVPYSDDDEQRITNTDELVSCVDNKPEELLSGNEELEKLPAQTGHPSGHPSQLPTETGHPSGQPSQLPAQTGHPSGQPLTAMGAKGTKYTMSFLTKGRRFSGDKKKLSN